MDIANAWEVQVAAICLTSGEEESQDCLQTKLTEFPHINIKHNFSLVVSAT